MSENTVKIGSRREVCWDGFLLDGGFQNGVSLKMHRPEMKNAALICDAPWEGNVCGYYQVFRDGPVVCMYYRGSDLSIDDEGNVLNRGPMVVCYAESADGKTFYKPELGICEFNGSKRNNIILTGRSFDNFSVFKDENPDCPEDERYKGLAGFWEEGLLYYKSADGLHFTEVGFAITEGKFDSLNLAFWDTERQEYRVYFRSYHMDANGNGVRDVRTCVSKDFKNWSPIRRIEFAPDKEDYQLYTNHLKPYCRAPQMLIATPTRYVDRFRDIENFKYLPDYAHRKGVCRGSEQRSGTAMTDCVLMTSRDGYFFDRTDEAFMTAGPEALSNWYYGDCYPAWGHVETLSDRPGEPNELSLYCGRNYRVGPVELMRHTLRLDGFFSWNCGYKPGTVITKPLVFDGARLEINFATSALGFVKIELCGENGEVLPGYSSPCLFGDSVRRPVDFSRSLSELAGRTVRLKISMSDADLYSFRFAPEDII
jgi:hypothetical protein